MNYLELPDRLLTEEELIRLAWLDLFSYMKDICDTLNTGGGLDWLYLPQDSKLFYERPSRTEQKIVYRVGASEYALQLGIDFDLRYVQMRREPCPFLFHRVMSVHDEQAYLCDREYGPPYVEQTMEAAAKGWMYELLLLDDCMGNTRPEDA